MFGSQDQALGQIYVADGSCTYLAVSWLGCFGLLAYYLVIPCADWIRHCSLPVHMGFTGFCTCGTLNVFDDLFSFGFRPAYCFCTSVFPTSSMPSTP